MMMMMMMMRYQQPTMLPLLLLPFVDCTAERAATLDIEGMAEQKESDEKRLKKVDEQCWSAESLWMTYGNHQQDGSRWTELLPSLVSVSVQALYLLVDHLEMRIVALLIMTRWVIVMAGLLVW